MAGSSPAPRRSQQMPSPSRTRLSELLSENRHTELNHQDALAAAQAEHERVREAAIRVYKDYESREEQRRLQEHETRIRQQQQREEERIRAEERVRAQELRLRELKAKSVPQLPPEPPAPKPSVPVEKAKGVEPSPAVKPLEVPASNLSQAPAPAAPAAAPQVNGHKPTEPVAIQATRPQQPLNTNAFGSSPFPQQNGAAIQAPANSAPPPPSADKYLQIHQNLKKLRSSVEQASKSLPPLKARMGDMRRELRKNMGQLIGAKGGNKQQVANICKLFNEALSGSVPSPLVDPSDYITDAPREPVQGAILNQPQLPSLFLYLLNHFTKSVINQFINECGASPRTADPIGVVVAQIFANKNYHWRGKTLVDILMAKFRVVCPVLFGYRGSEKTEQGRARLGWRKSNGGWAPEQQHVDRMKGLGVGYAAISLRDFSKSQNQCPWPPTKYWTSMARIVNTPAAEISNTQCVVLRAMIEIYEDRFLTFYGNAGIAALRRALVDFPSRAVDKTPAVSGLQVLASMLKRDIGIEL